MYTVGQFSRSEGREGLQIKFDSTGFHVKAHCSYCFASMMLCDVHVAQLVGNCINAACLIYREHAEINVGINVFAKCRFY